MNILFLLSLSLASKTARRQAKKEAAGKRSKSIKTVAPSKDKQLTTGSSVNPSTDLPDITSDNKPKEEQQKKETRNSAQRGPVSNSEVKAEDAVKDKIFVIDQNGKIYSEKVSNTPKNIENQPTGDQSAGNVNVEKQSTANEKPVGTNVPGVKELGEQTEFSQSVTAPDSSTNKEQGETKQTSSGAINQAADNAKKEEVSGSESSQNVTAPDSSTNKEQGENNQTSSGAIDKAADNAKKEEVSGSEFSSKNDASNPAVGNADKDKPITTCGRTTQEDPTEEIKGSNSDVTEKELKDATVEAVNPDNGLQETKSLDVSTISDKNKSSESNADEKNLTSKNEENKSLSPSANGGPIPPINDGGPNPPKKNPEPSKNDDNKQPSKGDDGYTNMIIWGLLALGFVNSVMLITIYVKIK
ncbi:putative SP-containing protein [Vairimorpha necatrix]|uniref:SP-containing protein n=1 Tax=Vairimorpha necatrix TaxID=6039 RepID=A0AAX4JFE1_9MICR